MKTLLWAMWLAAAATAVALALQHNQGSVVAFAPPWRVDFSLNFFNTGAMSLTELGSVTGATELRKLHHTLGTAGTVGVNSFAFTSATGIPFNVTVDGNTNFLFGAACPANGDCQMGLASTSDFS